MAVSASQDCQKFRRLGLAWHGFNDATHTREHACLLHTVHILQHVLRVSCSVAFNCRPYMLCPKN